MIRIFQFKNSFLSEIDKKVEAEYSAFGYYDGLVMKTMDTDNLSESRHLLSDPFQIEVSEDDPYEMCDYFCIAGMCEEDDKEFWEKGKKPYIFISCLRFVRKTKIISQVINEIEEKYSAKCYLTLDSSDLIVCLRTCRYQEGYQIVEKYSNIVREYDEENRIQKGFSVFVMWQKTLDELSSEDLSSGSSMEGMTEQEMELAHQEIQQMDSSETISCLLYCIVRDWESIPGFCDKLEECSISQFQYGILGSEDITLMIQNVQAVEWFAKYGLNNLMTHSNIFYEGAFYNIRTEILVDRKRGRER